MRGGLQALLVEHLGHGVGVGADPRACPSTVRVTDFWATKKASVPPTSPSRTRAKRLSWSERRTAHPGVTEPGQENGRAAVAARPLRYRLGRLPGQERGSGR